MRLNVSGANIAYHREQVRLKLIQYRQLAALSRAEASRVTGVGYQTLGSYERGERIPPADTYLFLMGFYAEKCMEEKASGTAHRR